LVFTAVLVEFSDSSSFSQFLGIDFFSFVNSDIQLVFKDSFFNMKNIKEHPTGFMKWRQKLGNTICIKDMLKFTFHHLKENKLKILRWKL
jgi:hypothetical protein